MEQKESNNSSNYNMDGLFLIESKQDYWIDHKIISNYYRNSDTFKLKKAILRDYVKICKLSKSFILLLNEKYGLFIYDSDFKFMSNYNNFKEIITNLFVDELNQVFYLKTISNKIDFIKYRIIKNNDKLVIEFYNYNLPKEVKLVPDNYSKEDKNLEKLPKFEFQIIDLFFINDKLSIFYSKFGALNQLIICRPRISYKTSENGLVIGIILGLVNTLTINFNSLIIIKDLIENSNDIYFRCEDRVIIFSKGKTNTLDINFKVKNIISFNDRLLIYGKNVIELYTNSKKDHSLNNINIIFRICKLNENELILMLESTCKIWFVQDLFCLDLNKVNNELDEDFVNNYYKKFLKLISQIEAKDLKRLGVNYRRFLEKF